MWSNFIEQFKDPHLVAKVQQFFGVDIHYDYPKKKSETIDLVNGCAMQENDAIRKKNVVPSPSEEDTTVNLEEKKHYTITNHFWYYLFLFGTELGDESFYTAAVPFWFWNIDGAVGRKIVFVWATVMTLGQALKDVICWPRPACPPAVRFHSRWELEYGMPSTHAMIAVAMPFSTILFTMNRYSYSVPIGCVFALLWCMLICVSRIYLGMHTVLDVIAGLVLVIAMMIPLVPLVDAMDYYLVTNSWALLAFVIINIATIVYYPRSDKWTPTRGDTAIIISVAVGMHMGAWLHYKTGALREPLLPPPYEVNWPSYSMLGSLFLRTMLGYCCILANKAVGKSLSYAIMCGILRVNSKELKQSQDSLENKNKILVDLVYRYFTYSIIGFNITYLLPNIFTMLGIERPTFYTEL